MITRNIIILLSLVQFSMNGLAQKQAEKLILNETIQYLSIDQNGYGGNIVVNVVDEKNAPITDYQSILRSGEEIVFDVPQSGPVATFFEGGSDITIEIKKKGYRSFTTKPFSTDEKMEKACVIKIVLTKE